MAARVVPAQLAFLAIFSPALAANDDAFRDQLVFYHSNKTTRRHDDEGDENERLRQIGLAQGMVDFARSFSDGEPIDHVDTEKSRIVMHELEKDWWILASIDLTRLPAAPSSSTDQPAIEYSAREVAPPELLLRQLLRAHSIFRLHHGPSLADLYVRLPRQKFCGTLERFWSRFSKDWDVLLHGNPASEIYPAMKLAAGGELGMGVGEEEWGSGEREVFEDFTNRTEGMVDMVVCRFGEPHPANRHNQSLVPADDEEPWMGAGRSPEPADGVIFSGVGVVSRSSLYAISNWMQWLYTYGDHAYGVKENPHSDRRKRRRRERMSKPTNRLEPHRRNASQKSVKGAPSRTSTSLPPGIPRPIVTAVEQSLDQASNAADANQEQERAADEQERSDGDTWMKYLTWGYSTAWGGTRPKPEQRLSGQSIKGHDEENQEKKHQTSMRHIDPQPDVDHAGEAAKAQIRRENLGHFLIGLQGDLEEVIMNDDDEAVAEEDGDPDTGWESRTLLRTLYVKLHKQQEQQDDERSSEDTILQPQPQHERLRIVIYVHRPFITMMLFEARTATLSYPAFYRHLHSYLAPLHKPLTISTSPNRVAARIAASSNPYTTTAGGAGPNVQPIYDLIYDPLHLTVHSSIPNIPEPGTASAEGLSTGSSSTNGPQWTRVEALNVHSQILATLGSARRAPNDIERTAKTSRGWWLVWMRLPPSQTLPDSMAMATSPALPASEGGDLSKKASVSSLKQQSSSSSRNDHDEEVMSTKLLDHPVLAESQNLPTATLREALLIRRSREAGPPNIRNSRHGGGVSASGSSLWRLGLGSASNTATTGGAAAGWGPRGLAEGVGIDARRYVEGLLSLSR